LGVLLSEVILAKGEPMQKLAPASNRVTSNKRGTQKGRRKKRQRSFEPTAIARRIAESILGDFSLASYCCNAKGLLSLTDVASVILEQQRVSILKKYGGSIAADRDRLTEEAYGRFIEINRHMQKYQHAGLDLPLVSVRPSVHEGFTRRDRVLLLARLFCHQILGDITTEEIFDAARHSQGTSLGVPFLDTSLEMKFTPPLTGTRDAISLFHRYLDYDPLLGDTLRHEYGPLAYAEKEYSRATTVDKDVDKRRFIAVEPTLNMFFQQGLMAIFYSRLRPFVNMTTAQELHRELAHQASRDGSLATIDWSSASDCVSSDLVRFLLPPKWWGWIDTVRTGFVSIKGDIQPCYMFATMGNATTFPLETIVFLSIGYALCQLDSNPNRVHVIPDFRNLPVSVFGDDCIVPINVADEYVSILSSVGFIVNEAKTFMTEGPGFRESCGGDFFRGFPVRPVFIKDPLDNRLSSLEPWLYSIMNRVLQKYILCFGSDDCIGENQVWRTFSAIFREHKLSVKLVPSDFPDDAGLHISPCVRDLFDLGYAWTKVRRNHMGFTRFTYLKFRYPDESSVSPALRYWLALKFPGEQLDPIVQSVLWTKTAESDPHLPIVDDSRPKRKGGGYVVASQWSSQMIVGWDLPV
jgi:hypothetical protein